jgi:ribose transport system permease protein
MRQHESRLALDQARALAAGIALLAGVLTIAYPQFATRANLEVMAMGFLFEAFLALGMTAVVITGGIDLSVGAVLPLSAIVTALLLRWDAPIPAAIGATLALTAAVGAANAGLSILLRVHPFIVTLGTMLSIKGVNLVITEGAPIAGLPREFASLANGRIAGLPAPLVLFAAVAALLALLLRRHRFWRQVYLIGGNPRAARAVGVRVPRVLMAVYVISAVLAGVAGVLAASMYGTANAGFGQNVELRVLAAVVIGGASLNGGSGTVGGTLLGVLFLAMLYNAFSMTGVSTYWQDVVTGTMVLGSVLGTELVGRRAAAVHPARG